MVQHFYCPFPAFSEMDFFLLLLFFWHQIKDYDKALTLELDSMEKFVLQCLAFYQV